MQTVNWTLWRRVAPSSKQTKETQTFIGRCIYSAGFSSCAHILFFCFVLFFLSLDGIQSNCQSAFCSQSAFGSGNLLLLWELCLVQRVECAYMVGKIKLVREEKQTDVPEWKKESKSDRNSMCCWKQYKYLKRQLSSSCLLVLF